MGYLIQLFRSGRGGKGFGCQGFAVQGAVLDDLLPKGSRKVLQQGRAGDGQLAINPVAVHRVQPGLCQHAAHIAFPCAGRPGYADKKRPGQV